MLRHAAGLIRPSLIQLAYRATILMVAFLCTTAVLPAATTPCALPGVTVVTDAGGDQTGSSMQDIQSISMAEIYKATDTANKLYITLKVASLDPLPQPSARWTVFFTRGTTEWFVAMLTDGTNSSATPGYVYGHTSIGTGGVRTLNTDGNVDAGSYKTDGTITFAISQPTKSATGTAFPAIQTGEKLTAINAIAQDSGVLLLATVDSTENGAYTIAGNASCNVAAATPSPTATATPTAAPSATPATGGGAPGVPRFFNYPAPKGSGDDSGEPSLGINYKTEKSFANSMFTTPNGGTSLYYGGFSPYILRVTFDDCSSPANPLWEQKQTLLSATPRAAGDPILFTDHETGRTFVSQLEGLTPAGSTTDITDDDGETFTPSEGSDLPSDIDHQTFGGGPFAPPLNGVPNPVYPHAVYYASQSVADARAALSVDGGRTFGQGVPMYTINDCAGLHGHIKVAPDGTAYVPNKACGGDLPYHDGSTTGEIGNASVIVSEDNGATWTIRSVPNAPTRVDDDPSVGVASDGTIYLGWQSSDGHPRAAMSKDKGKTWSTPVDVGQSVTNGAPVLNTTFPAVVAGDPDRAAFAFYGSETGGDNYHCGEGEDCSPAPAFPGVWYLYVASTFDGGKTWTTQNVTPGDPVQRSGICGGGTCRNLLDFFDIQMDKEGRVLVGWDDGCIGACVQAPPNSFTTKATISRQGGGKRLLAKYDPTEPALPGAPLATGSVDTAANKVTLTWQVPDNGGSAITGYHIFRRVGTTGNYTLIATVPETSYVDTTYDPTAENYYHVSAVNAIGEGPFCHDFKPVTGVVSTPCILPGVLVVSDINPDGSDNDGGQNTPRDPSVNIRQIFIAEPDLGAGVNQMIFTMQVGKGGTVAPNSGWYIVWNRLKPDANDDRAYVAMRSDANGNLSYEYGLFGVALDTSGGIPNPNSNVPNKVGAADKGSFDPATGLIQIRVTTSKLDALKPGDPMNGVNGRTFFGTDANGTPHNQAAADDITNDGSYVVGGNAACITNQAPVAQLTASPTQGPAPLTVQFDASKSSDPDAGDSIASYTFNFGDGSDEVTQNVPTISHTYTHGGSFFATVRVKDSHGQISANVPSVVIKINATLLNISTRLRVQTGDNVSIAGFIITGNSPKKVILRGIGPSLQANGQPMAGRMDDPTLELHDKNTVIASNDNWQDTQKAEVEASGIPPTNDRESAIVKTLNPGEYTVVLRGKDNGTGIAVVEVYDLDQTVDSQLANLSTRGFVETGDNVMIGGFVAGPNNAATGKLLMRAIGPSLNGKVPNALADPTMELHNQNGDLVDSNDDWKSSSHRADIEASGIPPQNDAESAIYVQAIEPGQYTAIVRGKNGGVGNGVVELYSLK